MPPSPDHTDAYFALGGALGAGALALIGAALQSQREDKRLMQQLQHDREMADLAEARAVADEAARAAWGFAMALAHFIPRRERLLDGQPVEDFTESGERVQQAAGAVEDMAGRLGLRLGPDDLLVQKYRVFVGATKRSLHVVMGAKTAPEIKDQETALSDALETTRDEFLEAFSERLGSQLPSPMI